MRGERQTDTGWQTYVWRKDPMRPKGGRQVSKNWPSDSTLAERKAWRTEQQLRGKRPDLFVEPDAAATTFADDARDYLTREAVRKMPTFKDRTQHINEWVAVFGHRERATIQPQEIQKELDKRSATLAASSLNNRRAALMHLWTTLDGKHQANPVKAVPPYEEPAPEPKAPALAAVLALLNGVSAKTEYSRKCRARLKVIAWTGWPHAVVKSIEPGDREHWQRGLAYVRRRQKGKGAKARWLPLLPQGKAALEEFHKADAYGHFSNGSLHRKVKLTCRRLKIAHIRPYDLRHFFGTLIATLTQDERAIMELMLVTTPSIIRRYTEAATNPRVQAAVAAVVRQLPGLLAAVRKVKTPQAVRAARQSVSRRTPFGASQQHRAHSTKPWRPSNARG
jgi:integrase